MSPRRRLIRDSALGQWFQHWWRLLALGLLILGSLALTRTSGLSGDLTTLRLWIHELGPWGPIAFTLLFVIATITLIPVSPLMIFAGIAYGTIFGTLLVSVSAALGASACFLIARHLARDQFSDWLTRHDKLRRLDLLTRRHGVLVVAVSRLIPFTPFALANYAFGLTAIPFWPYLLWSTLCLLPSVFMLVVGGEVLVRSISHGEIPWGLIALFAAVHLVSMLLVVYLQRRIARRRRRGG